MKEVPASLFQALIFPHFLSVKVGLRWTEGNSRLSDGGGGELQECRCGWGQGLTDPNPLSGLADNL